MLSFVLGLWSLFFASSNRSRLFPEPSYITDGTVAMACSLTLFVLPARRRRGPESGAGVVDTVLRWDLVQAMNWDVVFLLGGGFALSDAFEVLNIIVFSALFSA